MSKLNVPEEAALKIIEARAEILKGIREVIIEGSNSNYSYSGSKKPLTLYNIIRKMQSRYHFTLNEVEMKQCEILHFLKKIDIEIWIGSLCEEFYPNKELSREEFTALFIIPLILEGKVKLNELKECSYMDNWHISYKKVSNIPFNFWPIL